MARGPRLDAPLALHHVWNRGIDRGDIFRDDADRLNFLERIETLVRAQHFAIYAWALMRNHFHLLTRTGNLGLSATMRILEGGYANYFNSRHHRCGHLFQNRFKNTLVEDGAYFLELLRYIHLNPLRAGVVHDLVALGRYRWSGHAAMLGRQAVPWHDTDFGLLHFGRRHSQARSAYRRFVADALHTPEPDLEGGGLRRSLGLWQRLHPLRRGRERWSFDERIYGSSDFVDAVLADLNDTPGPPSPPSDVGALVERIVQALVDRTGMTSVLLRSNCKRPDVVKTRQALCYVAAHHAAIPASRLATYLGINESTVRRNLIRGEQALVDIGCTPRALLTSTP